LNAAGRLEPALDDPTGMPDFVVVPGRLVHHVALTPGMCQDVLKYVAPILANATQTKGEVSVDLDAWRLPLAHGMDGQGSGKLVLHSVEVRSTTPLIRAIASAVGAEAVVDVRESTVKFKMSDRKIEHQDLEFGMPYMRVRTHGTVGLDETLDLVAEIRPALDGIAIAERPLLRSLSAQVIKLPIHGTLSNPRVDTTQLTQSSASVVLEVLEELRSGKPVGQGEIVRRLREKGELKAPEGDVASVPKTSIEQLTDELLPMAANVLDRVRTRMQQRRETAKADDEARNEPGSSQIKSETSTSDAQRQAASTVTSRRPLRRLINRLARPSDAESGT